LFARRVRIERYGARVGHSIASPSTINRNWAPLSCRRLPATRAYARKTYRSTARAALPAVRARPRVRSKPARKDVLDRRQGESFVVQVPVLHVFNPGSFESGGVSPRARASRQASRSARVACASECGQFASPPQLPDPSARDRGPSVTGKAKQAPLPKRRKWWKGSSSRHTSLLAAGTHTTSSDHSCSTCFTLLMNWSAMAPSISRWSKLSERWQMDRMAIASSITTGVLSTVPTPMMATCG